MTTPTGPIRALWNACLLLAGAVFVLWVAYQLFLSMWVWVVGLIVAAVLFTSAVLLVRWRRNTW